MDLNIQEHDAGVSLNVKVAPGSSRTQIAGVLGSDLKIALATAPEKGKANKELIGFLAKRFGVSKSRIVIRSGLRSRHKEVFVAGLTAAKLRRLLQDIVGP